MKTDSTDSAFRLPQVALAGVASWYIVAYVLLASYRLSYPFDLEPLEGASIQQVRRILSNQSLYVRPSLEFVPFVYTPLYFYVSALSARVFGVSFFSLRLVSFLSSLGSFAVIFLLVLRETGSRFAALLASGLFAATFYASGSAFDVARVDSLFLFLLLSGLYLLRARATPSSYAVAGLLLSLAVLTKQTAVLIAGPIVLTCARTEPKRRTAWLITTAALVIILSTWWFERVSAGWYAFYVFKLPTRSGIRWRMLHEFWGDNMFARLPIALAVIGYSLWRWFRSGKIVSELYLVAAASMIAASWAGRINEGGYKNTLFPAYAAVAILFGVALAELLARIAERPRALQALPRTALTLLCLIQFVWLYYNPFSPLPRESDRFFGEALTDRIRAIEGDVLVPGHGEFVVAAGKKSYAHESAINDVMSDGGEVGEALRGEIRQALRSQKFDEVIVDCDRNGELFGEPIAAYYRRRESNCLGDRTNRPKPFVEMYAPKRGREAGS